jgi:hypothetical protein
MQPRTSKLSLDGAVGGLCAGAVVILWFLVLDIVQGRPLFTPTTLAAIFLGESHVSPSLGLLAGYTVLHFGVFAALGVAAAWALFLMDLSPSLLLGAAFGIGVLNTVHYGALLTIDVETVTSLPTIHVLLANLVGGMCLMAFLHRAWRSDTDLGLGWLRHHQLLSQGIGVGIVGGVAVALWFMVLDLVAGRPFFTPSALGSFLFAGATSPAEVSISLGTAAAYTVFHFAVFAALGTALVWASERIEHTPGLWLLGLMALIVIEVGFVGLAGVFGGWVLGVLGWWAVGIGNVLAVAVMGTQVWKTHPGLRRKLVEQPVSTMV